MAYRFAGDERNHAGENKDYAGSNTAILGGMQAEQVFFQSESTIDVPKVTSLKC
jgi:hypothetical protein